QIDAKGTLEGPSEAAFAFVDAVTEERWTVRPNQGAVPWWILSSNRRIPGTRAKDYLTALALGRADPPKTVAEVLNPNRSLFRRFWEPLVVAALNTGTEQASAMLFWKVLRETLGRGGVACRPLVPRLGLTETFVEPALSRLQAKGAEIRLGT